MSTVQSDLLSIERDLEMAAINAEKNKILLRADRGQVESLESLKHQETRIRIQSNPVSEIVVDHTKNRLTPQSKKRISWSQDDFYALTSGNVFDELIEEWSSVFKSALKMDADFLHEIALKNSEAL